jgi:hypothetical protein
MQPNSDYYLCTEEEGEIVEPYLPDKSGTIAEKYQLALQQTQIIYKTNQKLLQESLELAPLIVELEDSERQLVYDEKVGKEKRAAGQAKMKEVGQAMTSQRTEWQTEKIRMSKNMILQEAKLANLTRQLNSIKEKKAESERIMKEMEQKRYAVEKILRTMRRKVAKLKGEEPPPEVGSVAASSIGTDDVASSVGDSEIVLERIKTNSKGSLQTRRTSKGSLRTRKKGEPMQSVAEVEEAPPYDKDAELHA